MALLIRNARVYAPKDLGITDVLMAAGKILAVGSNLTVSLPDLETVDAKGKILTPGFFDQHIHVNGGGGEGGFASRTPEIMLSELVKVGTTSIVGVCGTDFISRSIENLLAKVRALSIEGVSAWMYTSNYRFPCTSMSQSVAQDLFLVPECLGVKIALGDHRSSFPRPDEVLHLLSDIRLTGMITGKGGVLHVHMGDIPGIFDMFLSFEKGGFPIRHILRRTAQESAKCTRGRLNSPATGALLTTRPDSPATAPRQTTSQRPSPPVLIPPGSRCRLTVTAQCPALMRRVK